MRTRLALAALGLGIAGAVLPTTSASAVCIDPLHLTGRCLGCPSGDLSSYHPKLPATDFWQCLH